VGEDDGRVQHFQKGSIAWHEDLGAHEVHGAIAVHWRALGDTRFGYPFTDEQITPDGSGRYNHFRAVHEPTELDRSIYWHPDTAAHELRGLIRAHWASLGWEKSKVGYPVSDERSRQGAGRRQDFQRGAIAWVMGGDAWVDWFRSQ
jgi:uncharacterized protein with LGFP repeats